VQEKTAKYIIWFMFWGLPFAIPLLFIDNQLDKAFYIIFISIVFVSNLLNRRLDKIEDQTEKNFYECKIVKKIKAYETNTEDKNDNDDLFIENLPREAMCDGIKLPFPPFIGLNIRKDASSQPAMEDWENAYSRVFHSGKIEEVVWDDDFKKFTCYVEPYFCSENQTTQEIEETFEKKLGWVDFSKKREYWHKD